MTARKLHVACVQLRSTDDVQENIALTSALIRAAHKDGAQFIATPENTTLMAPDGGAIWFLTKRLGMAKAKELVFTGRHIGAAEARECHLIERIVPPAGLDEAVEDWVSAIIAASPGTK